MQHVDRDVSTQPRSARSADWLLPGLVLVTGILLCLGPFLWIRARERNARLTDFMHRAARLAATAEDSFDTPLEVLRSIPAFFEASEQVTRTEFRAFVREALQRYPGIYALEWIPRVAGHERAAYEAAAVADGLAGYHFKQDAPSGPPVPAEPRAEYYPLYYMEPPNAIALGIDEPALPARRIALERARDHGVTAVSAGLKLVQDAPGVASVIAFHPIYQQGANLTDVESRRQSLRGFAAAVLRIESVLAASLKPEDLASFDLVVIDADAEPQTVLYQSRPGAQAALATEATLDYDGTLAARHWLFRVGDRGGYVRAGGAGWAALGIGALLSALAAGLVYHLRSARRLRRQVEAARRLGQYTLVEKLGEGGMGTVYRAHHAMLRRPTAIKLLDPRRTNPASLARFEAEVQLTSSLSHPNTVVVYDYGRSPSGFYYAMEYIQGITLQALVEADGAQPAERVVHILVQICAALVEAHAIGLVHRDVKPANVMLCNRGGIPDFVKVLDFGLAKDLTRTSDPQQSQTASLIGTPLHVAPELILHREGIDGRVDLYSLGSVAYFLLTGTPVFDGNTTVEVCAKHISVAPEFPSHRLGCAVPGGLESLVMRCLAKDPAQRPDSAGALREELRALSLPAWDIEQARLWWENRGAAIERQLRAARVPLAEDAQGVSISRIVDVDQQRRAT